MTGTAETSKEEFYKVYGLVVTPIPTHNPITHVSIIVILFFKQKKESGKLLQKK
jgi:preprotein translocase subunit SecA